MTQRNDKIRVAYLVSDPSISLDKAGGPSAHIKSTIKGIRSHGLDMRLFLSSDYCQASRLPETATQRRVLSGKRNQGVLRCFAAEIKRRVSLRHLPNNLVRDLESYRPHVIYERSSIFSSAGSRLAGRLECMHLLETSCCEAEIFNDAYGLISVKMANFLEAYKLRGASAVITQSCASVLYCRSKFRLSRNIPVIAKPLAYEIPSEPSLDSVPEGVKVFTDRFNLCVIFIGTFGKYQGTDFLLKIIRQSGVKCPAVGFLLCGAGGMQEKCMETAQDENMQNVLFTGMLTERQLNAVQLLADLAIVPDCERHMAPIKTFQYGASGLPVLVPNYDAFEDFVENGRDGFKFEPHDIFTAVNIITHCASNREELAMMGKRIREKVLSRYNPHEVVSETCDFIRRHAVTRTHPRH
jgi:glycosyltransferase involved in cell wall biosynthesis